MVHLIKVPHNRFIKKMERYGINGSLNLWVQSFLSSCMQRVVCEGEKSSGEPVTSGVPQASAIGSILFLLYINDLPDGLKSQVSLFAEATIVYMLYQTPLMPKTIERLQPIGRVGEVANGFSPSKV